MDDHLSPEEREKMDHHLKTCQKCSAALHDLRKTVEYARDVEEMDPPAWLTQKVMARVRDEQEKKGILRKLFYPLHVKIPAEILAALAIAVVTVYVFKSVQPVMKRAETPVQEVTVLREGKKARAAAEEETPASRGIVSHYAKTRTEESKREESAVPASKANMNKKISGGSLSFEMDKTQKLSAPTQEPERMSKQINQTRTLTIHVNDIESARDEFEKSVKTFGGHILETDSTPASFIYVVNIDSRKMKDFKNDLDRIGKFEPKPGDHETLDSGNIRIELVDNRRARAQ
jgi:hypothetical protein